MSVQEGEMKIQRRPIREKRLARTAVAFFILFSILMSGKAFPGGEWARLHQEAVNLLQEGRWDEGVTVARKAVESAKREFGPDHLNVARSLETLADLHLPLEKESEAEKLYKLALSIYERKIGKGYSEVPQALTGLAALYDMQYKGGEVERLYKRALVTYGQSLGKSHPAVAIIMTHLAEFYDYSERFKEAEQLYRQALAILDRAPDANQPLIGRLLEGLENLYLSKGGAKKEPLLSSRLEQWAKRKRGIQKKIQSLLEEGTQYEEKRLLAKAEENYKKVITLVEKELAPEAEEKVLAYGILSDFYLHQKRYPEAETFFRKKLALLFKRTGPEHRKMAQALGDLAEIYKGARKYREAETTLKGAIAVSERAYGKDSPYHAKSLNDLAFLYYDEKKYAEAIPLYKQALDIIDKKWPAKELPHPDTPAILVNLAVTHVVTGSPEQALPLMVRAVNGDDDEIENFFSIATEEEKFDFLYGPISLRYWGLLGLVSQKLPQDLDAVKAGFTAVLRRKGIVMEGLLREKEALVRETNPEVDGLRQSLHDVIGEMSVAISMGVGEDRSAYIREIARLQEQRETLERKLSELSKAYAYTAELQRRRVTLERVSGILPEKAALIEYVRIPSYRFGASSGKEEWGEERYLALFLPSTRGGGDPAPLLADLGEASVIDRAIQEFRQEIAKARAEFASGSSREGEEAALERKLAARGRALYDLVLSPFNQALKGYQILFLAPDADLNLIPFGSLQDQEGKYLMEKFQLNYLSSGRDLLRLEEKTDRTGNLVVVADPDFDMSADERTAEKKRLVSEIEKSQPLTGAKLMASRGIPPLRDLTSMAWEPLPGTREEGEAIMKILPAEETRLYLQKEALEEVVKMLQSPRCLHLATHGFFLQGRGGKEAPETLSEIEMPLLQSGLVLAGANRVGREKLPPGSDDGILTALEVYGMQLWGTDLVVLSACETGLGVAVGGEGVFGLRRAFQLAGARTVVMSLWSVPDQQTQELMVDFYRRLNGGAGKAQALRESQLSMIQARRKQYGAAHPFFWGAFICVGEP